MSRIYFHSPSGTAEVRGAERAYANILCHDLLCVAMGMRQSVTPERVALYRTLIPPHSYLHQIRDSTQFVERLQTWMLVGMEGEFLLPDGTSLSPTDAALNTAVVAGSDPVRLLAKLHGQCEIHAYVEGPHRAWLADIIDAGLHHKILRLWKEDRTGWMVNGPSSGWDAVVELLRSRDDEPVVTSYSVCEQFPRRSVAQTYGSYAPIIDGGTLRKRFNLSEEEDISEWEDEYRSDHWHKLSTREQWRFAMEGLREATKEGKLEMTPETLAIQGYGRGRSGFDIMAMLVDL